MSQADILHLEGQEDEELDDDAPRPIGQILQYFQDLTDQRALEVTPTAGEARQILIEDALAYFLSAWPNEGASRSTVRTYRYYLRWLANFAREHGRRNVSDLDADFLRTAMGVHRKPPEKGSWSFKGGEVAANQLLHSTRKFLGWLSAQGVKATPDLSTLKCHRVPERVQVRLTPEEFRRMQDAILRVLVEGRTRHAGVQVARDLALIYLLADTGLRANEVIALTTADIDFERVRVRVRRGKGGRERLLSILDPTDVRGGDTIRLLGEWLRARSTLGRAVQHNILFTSASGWPLTMATLRKILARICNDAGLDGNRPPHAFRRATFTERYRTNPEAVDVLAARMGWSNKSRHMVNTYTRGAQLDFAAEVALPSLASVWGGSTHLPAAQAPPVPTRPAVEARPKPRRRSKASGEALRRLFAAVGDDPELLEALVQALGNGS